MKNKKFYAVLLALVLLFSSFSHIFALNAFDSEKSKMSDIYAIAKNAPSFFVPTKNWDNITIEKTTPLYDLDENIIAYCVDIKNSETEEFAYLIISPDETETPVMQFAPFVRSPYYDLSTSSRALYLAPGIYHKIEGDLIIDLTTKETYQAKQILEIYQSNKATVNTLDTANEELDFAALREVYISGIQPRGADTRERILSTVPNWQWTLGCAPTAIGMQLAKLYPTLNTTTTITELAAALQTTSAGVTPERYIPQRTAAYIVSKGLGTPSYCNYQNSDSSGSPLWNLTYNPYSTYLTEINAGRPVCIYSKNATISTTGYPNGWGSHMITGVGYSYMTSGSEKYVIVHTTAAYDGKVYININTKLGDFAWFIVQP